MTMATDPHGTVVLLRRPEPPSDLTPKQAALWRQVVDSKEATWFDAAAMPLLRAYVRTSVLADELAGALNCFEMTWLAEDGGLQRLDRLVSMHAKLCNTLGTLAVKMRLSQQSRYTPGAAATASKRAGQLRPWESRMSLESK